MILGESHKMIDQKLTVWCSNNWCMERGMARKSNNFRPKCTDIIWNMRQDDVMKEIAKILKVETVTTTTPGWFSAQTSAIKNIVERMMPDELTVLAKEREEVGRKGYNEKLQRRYASDSPWA